MNYIIIETVHSILTPDAGHCSTVYVSAETLEFPFYDKSVAISRELLPNYILLEYKNGQFLLIPWGNIRFISEAKEIKKENKPHKIDPVFGIVKPRK